MITPNRHHELPMLAGLASVIRWFEELINLVSGPLLTFGLGISLIDLLTDGALLVNQPALLYGWAISQAVGVDGQLVASWDRARQAVRDRRWLPLIGLVLLGTALGYVAWVSAQVFGIQQAEGLTTAQAISQLGMNPSLWLIQRSLLAVLLVCLSGWNRYHPPVKVEATLEDEKAKLERELALEPLRQQARQLKARGAVSLVRGLMRGDDLTADTQERPDGAEPTVPRYPTGGGSPTAAPVRTHEPRPPRLPILRLTPERKRTAVHRGTNGRGVRTGFNPDSYERQARLAFTQGATSITKMMRATGMSRNAASGWVRTLKAEHAQVDTTHVPGQAEDGKVAQ